MSLPEHSLAQVQGDNVTEYTFITTPGENGEVVQQLFQHLGTSEQENIDPSTQILMLQPITVHANGDQDGQYLQQYQILHDATTLEQLQQIQAALGENQVLQITPEMLQQHLLQGDATIVEHSPLTEHKPNQQNNDHQHQIQFVFENELQEDNQQEMLSQAAQYVQHKVAMATLPIAIKKEPDVQPPIGKGPFRCEKCDREYPKWGAYNRHMKTHEDDKPFACPKCDLTFNVEDNLTLHMALHQTDDPKCPECGKKFSRIASLKAHLMLHEKEESLICPECGDEYALQAQLDRHMNEHRSEMATGKSYPCRQCTLVFTRPIHLKEHMKHHYKFRNSISHKTYKRNIDRSSFHHKCTHCSKSFQKPSQLQRHLRIHTGERPYVCEICEKTFNQKGALQIHMSKHTGDKPHSCSFCPMTFSQKGNLRAHIQRVHNTPKDNNTPVFRCDECSCVYRKLGSLNAHLSRAHADAQDFVLQQKTEGGRTVIDQLLSLGEQLTAIPVTNEKMLRSDILQQALENSGLTSGEVKIKSQGADASQVASDNISISMVTSEEAQTVEKALEDVPRLMNEKQIEMECTQESIISTMALHDSATGTIKRHIIRKINGVKWHQCIYCTKEFKKPSDLIRHIRIHTHEKPYKCDQCFRSFAVRSTLKSHERTHQGVKAFQCTTCDKHFSTHGSLKVHLRLHTGDKPYECPHCDKQFRTSGHRKTHVISHYRPVSERKPRKISKRAPKQNIDLPDISLQEPILITETGLIQQPSRIRNYPNIFADGSSVDRPFKCPHCSRGFKKSSHLKQHIRSHTGEKPFKCNKCQRQFVSSGVLKAHSRTHIGIKSYKCIICDSTFTTNGSLKRHMSTHSELRPFMCPYCQKTFKTSVNCKKHMKTHKPELAMQALAQQGLEHMTGITKNEVTISSIPDADDDDDDDMMMGAPQEIQIEIAPDDLTHTMTLPMSQYGDGGGSYLAHTDSNGHITILSQEHQEAAANIAQETEVMMQEQLSKQVLSHVELQHSGLSSHAAVIQEALVRDLGLTNTLSQQVLEHQGLSHREQRHIIHLNGLDLNQGQYSLQEQTINSSITQTNTSVSTGLQSTSMQNILQTKDASEMSLEGDTVLNLESSEDVESSNIMFEEMVDKATGRRPHQCAICEKAFKKISHLKQHMRSHTGEKPFKCTLCERSFVSMGVLRAHIKTHIGAKDYKCEICSCVFTTNGSLTRHMMVHNTQKPYKCPYCSEEFRNANPCRRHIRMHHVEDENSTEKENSSFLTRRTRSNFIQITEDQATWLAKVPMDENMSLSEKLLIESASEKNRVSIIKTEAEPSNDEDYEHIKNEAYPNKCSNCPKSFKKPSDLVRHIRIHTGEKPYICELCQKSFTVKSTLESHMKTHSPGEKLFKCHVCTSSFSTKGSMKVHMRLHTGAKPFKCPHCLLMFRTSGHRKSHIQSHFKQANVKRTRRSTIGNSKLDDLDQISNEISLATQSGHTITLNDQTLGNQVITIDQATLQQGVLPISLSITDSYGNLADGALTAQVLQSLEGLQLHLSGNVTQGVQITGLDANVLSQAIHVDASLLSQLQQGGNLNLTINPSFLNTASTHQTTVTPTIQTVDPNQVQNFVNPSSSINLSDVVNPNIVIQSGLGQEQSVSSARVMRIQNKHMSVTELSSHQAAQVEQQTLEALGVIQKSSQQMNINEQNCDDPFVHEGASEENLEQFDDSELVQGAVLEGDDDEESLSQGTTYEVIHVQGSQGLENLGMQTQAQEMNSDPDRSHICDPDRSHLCEVCNKAFKRAGHLKEHMLTHGPGPSPSRLRPMRYRCNECEKAFSKPSQLERHRRIHTGERPFTCELCFRAFNQKNALQVHLKKHSGEKPHKCPYCDSEFTQKGNLKTHIKRAHHHEMVLSMNLNPKQEHEEEEEDADDTQESVEMPVGFI